MGWELAKDDANGVIECTWEVRYAWIAVKSMWNRFKSVQIVQIVQIGSEPHQNHTWITYKRNPARIKWPSSTVGIIVLLAQMSSSLTAINSKIFNHNWLATMEVYITKIISKDAPGWEDSKDIFKNPIRCREGVRRSRFIVLAGCATWDVWIFIPLQTWKSTTLSASYSHTTTPTSFYI